MTNAALNRAWRRLVEAMQWPGLAALAVLLVSAGLVFIVGPQRQRQLDALQAEADEARSTALRRARQQSASQLVASQSPMAQWLQGLPGVGARQGRVAELLGRASAHALIVKRSDYRDGNDAASGLTRYRVNLPVVGSYENLRAYLEDVLAADPALLLDGIRLRRGQAQATQVQAELQFSLLMREPAAAGVGAEARR